MLYNQLGCVLQHAAYCVVGVSLDVEVTQGTIHYLVAVWVPCTVTSSFNYDFKIIVFKTSQLALAEVISYKMIIQFCPQIKLLHFLMHSID